jgi:hypothetical protein
MLYFHLVKWYFKIEYPKKKIGERKLQNGLYYLQNRTNLCLVSSNPVNRAKLLHQRFSHSSDYVLTQLFCYNLDSSNCEVCKFLKQTRLFFPLSTNKSEKYFDLIHSDI